MGFMHPKSPAPPPPLAPLQQIDAKTSAAQTEEQKQLALMRGINSTWTSQSMLGPQASQGGAPNYGQPQGGAPQTWAPPGTAPAPQQWAPQGRPPY